MHVASAFELNNHHLTNLLVLRRKTCFSDRSVQDHPIQDNTVQEFSKSPIISLFNGLFKKLYKEGIMELILASTSVGISELKSNPTAILEASGNKPVAILNRNKPVGYMLTAEAWEKIHEILEDRDILRIVEARLSDGKKNVKVSLNDL